jgi:hypothetical protein
MRSGQIGLPFSAGSISCHRAQGSTISGGGPIFDQREQIRIGERSVIESLRFSSMGLPYSDSGADRGGAAHPQP